MRWEMRERARGPGLIVKEFPIKKNAARAGNLSVSGRERERANDGIGFFPAMAFFSEGEIALLGSRCNGRGLGECFNCAALDGKFEWTCRSIFINERFRHVIRIEECFVK